MEYRKLTAADLDALWELHTAYKAEIKEAAPSAQDKERLREAIDRNSILFFGAWKEGRLAGVCSVTVGFSTFNYGPSGVLEDFYIRPDDRHQGIARELVRFARAGSGVASLTVGCANCDVPLYKAIGFSLPLGNLLAYDG